MTTSSLSGKPDDYESRKKWTNKDWYTHVGAWENEQGQLCFGSSAAFCAMLEQFHRTHTQHIPELVSALQDCAGGLSHVAGALYPDTLKRARIAIARATGAA